MSDRSGFPHTLKPGDEYLNIYGARFRLVRIEHENVPERDKFHGTCLEVTDVQQEAKRLLTGQEYFARATSIKPVPTAIPASKEDDMNTNDINTAIKSLAAEEAMAATRPVYDKISKLVDKTKVGQAITLEYPKRQGSWAPRFFCRLTDTEWAIADWDETCLTADVVKELVTAELSDHKTKITKLTKEGK